MKLAQLKWIGLAALATSLSAGGVVAFAVSAGGQKTAESPRRTEIDDIDDERPGSRPWRTRSIGS